MKPHLILSAFLGVAFLVAGCAYVTHEPVKHHAYPSGGGSSDVRQEVKLKNNEEDRQQTGVRYYLSSPYLLVYTDGKGKLLWKIHHLPDQTKLMVATPTQFFAKTNAKLTFTDGVLTASKTDVDSSAALKAVIGALEKLLPLLLGISESADPPGTTKFPAPRLYKIVVDQDNLKLIGVQSKETVSVTLKPGSSR